jgi:hypothetical protein
MPDATLTDSIAGVRVKHVERIFSLLRDKLPKVLEANRFFEEETGIHNEAGANNLVDTVSHLATLVEHAHELDSERQAEQVAYMEDHLRRSMMEAFEQVLKYRLGEIAKLWDEYQRLVRPRQMRGALAGVAQPQQLEALRKQMKALLEAGRATKREITWEDWEVGTDYLVQACEVASELERLLSDGIAAARSRASLVRRRLALAACSGLALLIGVGIGVWLG